MTFALEYGCRQRQPAGCNALPGSDVGAFPYRGLVSSWGNVHGIPGGRLVHEGAGKYGAAAASRGGFIERAVARALENWLSRRPDRSGLHLFHDLGGFDAVTGFGWGPLSLGSANMDHVILSGQRWVMVDAKGLGAGTLTTDARGCGILIQQDGTELPQRWMDVRTERSAAGVLVRLTGLRGWPVWVLPDVTTLDLDSCPPPAPSGRAAPLLRSPISTPAAWTRCCLSRSRPQTRPSSPRSHSTPRTWTDGPPAG